MTLRFVSVADWVLLYVVGVLDGEGCVCAFVDEEIVIAMVVSHLNLYNST